MNAFRGAACLLLAGLACEPEVASIFLGPTSVAAEAQDRSAAPRSAAAQRLDPKNVVYIGAFRLPAASGGSSWEWSGEGLTYFPLGDPDGAEDGYPGSLFGVGHDHHQQVSEVSIPAPVISPQKRLDDLPTARTLQPFYEVRGVWKQELEIPRVGLAYLPPLAGAAEGRLHFCWGQHFESERVPSHGWCSTALAHPNPQGLWYLGAYTNYVTNDYMCDIPPSWSEKHLPGYRLATGRFRDGTWGGRGPAVLAYVPPEPAAPPEAGATIDQVRPLLMYGTPQAGISELETSLDRQMRGFSESDDWSGVAWLTAGARSAVVFVGTKAKGKTWYGYANGVTYPVAGESHEPIPEVPPYPFDARGWWSSEIAAQMIFFDPEQLAAVAKGKLASWQPQPYAVLELDRYLFDPGYDHPRQKRYLVGACCFDRQRGVLYIAERRADEEEKSLIHVFRVH